MHKIRERLRAIERERPPELWTEIMRRAARPEPEEIARHLRPVPSGRPFLKTPTPTRRLIAGLVAGLIAVAGFVFVREAFRTRGVTPGTSPSASSGSTSGQTPAGWQRCSRPDLGFSIAYPGGWYTPGQGELGTSPGPAKFECLLFEPKPFQVPLETAPVALVVSVSHESFARKLSDDTDPSYVQVLAQQDTRIAGVPAVRLETEASGQGAENRGTKYYDYILDLGSRGEITVGTTSVAGDYEANKSVVDQAAASLTLS